MLGPTGGVDLKPPLTSASPAGATWPFPDIANFSRNKMSQESVATINATRCNTMRVICKSNELSDLLLTGIHRTYFESRFGPETPPVWQAEIGREYTVYAVSIHRGYPFYFVASSDSWQPFQTIPSLCFEIVDPRLSTYWLFKTRVVEYRGDQTFSTTLAFKEWFEPMFLSNLVDGYETEGRVMRTIANLMDAEFNE